jgi:hypothetical protein
MKILGSILLLSFMLAFNACKDNKKEEKPAEKSAAPAPKKVETGIKESPTGTLKIHECTEQCKEGKHVYVHGEEGHTCSEECMKTQS